MENKKKLKGAPGKEGQYLNEDLTYYRARLAAIARKEDRSKYVFSKNGRVLCYMKDIVGPPIALEKPSDLKKIGINTIDMNSLGFKSLGSLNQFQEFVGEQYRTVDLLPRELGHDCISYGNGNINKGLLSTVDIATVQDDSRYAQFNGDSIVVKENIITASTSTLDITNTQDNTLCSFSGNVQSICKPAEEVSTHVDTNIQASNLSKESSHAIINIHVSEESSHVDMNIHASKENNVNSLFTGIISHIF